MGVTRVGVMHTMFVGRFVLAQALDESTATVRDGSGLMDVRVFVMAVG